MKRENVAARYMSLFRVMLPARRRPKSTEAMAACPELAVHARCPPWRSWPAPYRHLSTIQGDEEEGEKAAGETGAAGRDGDGKMPPCSAHMEQLTRGPSGGRRGNTARQAKASSSARWVGLPKRP